MPNPKKYKNQKQFMKDCLHTTLHMEKKEKEHALAQCLNMWRQRKRQKAKKVAALFIEKSNDQ